jgi:hypothetical protein
MKDLRVDVFVQGMLPGWRCDKVMTAFSAQRSSPVIQVRDLEGIFQIDGAVKNGNFHGRRHFPFGDCYPGLRKLSPKSRESTPLPAMSITPNILQDPAL